jgi:RNA polymerase sigma-70 factor, ECF subfamily
MPRSLWSTVSTSMGYHVFHAIRGELLRRLGRDAEAAVAHVAAIARTGNAPERAFLRRMADSLRVQYGR